MYRHRPGSILLHGFIGYLLTALTCGSECNECGERCGHIRRSLRQCCSRPALCAPGDAAAAVPGPSWPIGQLHQGPAGLSEALPESWALRSKCLLTHEGQALELCNRALTRLITHPLHTSQMP